MRGFLEAPLPIFAPMSFKSGFVTILGKPLVTSDLSGSQQQMSDRCFIHFMRFIKRNDMLTRNDQNMGRSLRTEVVKGNANIVLIDQLHAHAAVGYLTKNAVCRAHITNDAIKPQTVVKAETLSDK